MKSQEWDQMDFSLLREYSTPLSIVFPSQSMKTLLFLLSLFSLSQSSPDEFRLLQYLKEVSNTCIHYYYGLSVSQLRTMIRGRDPSPILPIHLMSKFDSCLTKSLMWQEMNIIHRSQYSFQDEKNQVMTILAYIDYVSFSFIFHLYSIVQHWTDYKLRWDPSRFGGIEDIRFSGSSDASHKIWKPDILLFNRYLYQ